MIDSMESNGTLFNGALDTMESNGTLFNGALDTIDSNGTTNCTVDSYVADWGLRYFAANFIISFVGALGNIAALWSLFRCRKTNLAAKIQLGTFFGVQLGVCILTLPGFSFVKKLALMCLADQQPMELKLFFLFAHTFLLPIERINFTAMAVFRLVAVRWPHHYKKISRVSVVVVMEVLIILYVLSPWLLAFGIDLHNRYPIEDQMTVTFSAGKTGPIRAIYLIHGVNHLFPTFASLFSYSLMIYTMIRQKQLMGVRKDTSATTMDHVAYTIRMVILINLVLDVPHTLAHLLRVSQVPSLIIHSIFYMHLALDPFIFVGMNLHYRKALVKSLKSCFRWERKLSVRNQVGQELQVQRASLLTVSQSSQVRSGATNVTNNSGVSNDSGISNV